MNESEEYIAANETPVQATKWLPWVSASKCWIRRALALTPSSSRKIETKPSRSYGFMAAEARVDAGLQQYVEDDLVGGLQDLEGYLLG
ncbi:hypothetical protein ACGTN6_05495 [Halomonas sp. THAF12]|uniref:hypothetical protein n=1 Tax=Halomonas sp. B23F22_10 TaxID=3459515 RepID=UPI00373F491C